MLSFDPPYLVVDGYTLLADHEDPSRWYAIPPAPSLVLGPDGRPQLSILEYLGGGGGAAKLAGAVLNLSTSLALPDGAGAALAPRIREHLGQSAPASVTVNPVLFDSGTVELIVLGSSSGVPAGPGGSGGEADGGSGAATGAAGGPGGSAGAGAAGARAGPGSPFQIAFAGSGLPSLGGDNRASFQLVLDENAAQLLDACLDAPDLPVLVVYRMQLSGLRPSFSIKVDADWSKVYHDLEQRAKVNVYYVSTDVQTMVSETLEHDDVRVDTTVYGTGADAVARADKAQKFLFDWVTSRLFEPLVDPTAAAANAIGDVVDDVVFSLARSVLPGLGYKLKAVSDDELRTMSARMDETVAERREIVPQGTLGGALNSLRVDEHGAVRSTWPALRSSLRKQVNLADFPRLEVQVGTEDRFTSDGLSQVTVELARAGDDGAPTDDASYALRQASDREAYVVNLLGRATPSLAQPYRWRMDVRFDPAGPFGPHPPASIDWRDGATEALIVEPREAYDVPSVAVAAAPTFSWSQFPAVEVDLRYTDPTDPRGIVQHARVSLTEAHPEDSWRFRAVAARSAPMYSYQVTYDRPGDQGGPISLPEAHATDAVLTIPDPLPRKRRLNIFVSLPWDKIATAFLELQYRDDPNGIRSDEQLDLAADTSYIRKDIPIAEDGPSTVSYRLTVLFQDGRLMEGSWRTTDDDRLVVDHMLVDSRAVTVRLVGGPLEAHHLTEIHVRLEVDDPATGVVRAQTEIDLDAGNEAAPILQWEYLAGDPPAAGVRYQAVFIDDHGFATTTDWATSTSDLLVVSATARTISG